MMRVSIKIKDHAPIQRLQRTAARLGQLEVPNKRIAAYFDQWVHRNMDSEGGLLSDGAWLPFVHGGRLLPDGRIDTSAKLLQDTRTMYMHINVFFDRSKAGVGNDIPYAETHEEGDGFTPQRRMLPREDEIMPRVEEIYSGYIEEIQK